MSKRGLAVVAVILVALIFVVFNAGLDNLPQTLRTQIAAERTTLSQAESQFRDAKAVVQRALEYDPALFRVRSYNTVWPQKIRQAETDWAAAAAAVAELERYAKSNRRQDRERVEQLVQREQRLRKGALESVTQMASEAKLWLDRKKNLPQYVAEIEREYRGLRAADTNAVAAKVQKAIQDWPAKRTDLETRLSTVQSAASRAEPVWQAIEAARGQQDTAAVFENGERIRDLRAQATTGATELATLTDQLYTSWDKVLVDQEDNESAYRQKIRTITNRIQDVAAKKSDIKSNEAWREVSRADFRRDEKNLGMSIEHKDAGKYDTEAERVAQPADFAYMAPPTQGSNQYGYWDRRADGTSAWAWFPQYLILSQLLANQRYMPPSSFEYEQYRNYRQRGQTYYGQDSASSRPKYGTEGVVTQRRYSESKYVQRGGYRGSDYESRGRYRGSEYEQRPGGFYRSRERSDSGDRFGAPPPRSSGNGGGWWRERPRSSPGGMRSAPRSGGGMRFGGRRR